MINLLLSPSAFPDEKNAFPTVLRQVATPKRLLPWSVYPKLPFIHPFVWSEKVNLHARTIKSKFSINR